MKLHRYVEDKFLCHRFIVDIDKIKSSLRPAGVGKRFLGKRELESSRTVRLYLAYRSLSGSNALSAQKELPREV